MKPGPYPVMRQISAIGSEDHHTPVWQYEVELADVPNRSARREKLEILTQVVGRLPDHPQALHLAALLHVRDLLDQQIAVMQTPQQ